MRVGCEDTGTVSIPSSSYLKIFDLFDAILPDYHQSDLARREVYEHRKIPRVGDKDTAATFNLTGTSWCTENVGMVKNLTTGMGFDSATELVSYDIPK